jgi:cob(I)alamin adenosyltransferase
MVVLNKIYTRSGDKGTAALGNNERRSKSDVRLEAIGAIDEANAAIGLARLHAHADLDRTLARVQNDLFDLGADLAVPRAARRGARASVWRKAR